MISIRIRKEIPDVQSPWEVAFYLGGRCKLTVHSDEKGPFAYELIHEDAVFAPAVNVTPTMDGSVLVLLIFRDMVAELWDSDRICQAVTEIQEFCEACETEGILNIRKG